MFIFTFFVELFLKNIFCTYLFDGSLTGTTILGLNGHGSNGNQGRLFSSEGSTIKA